MKLHRFYISEANLPDAQMLTKGTVLTVRLPELFHQVKNVLKLQPGEKIIFFNGDGNEYESEIVNYEGKEGVVLKIEEITQNDVSFPRETYLFFSILKKDNVDWILEKGTEIGVSHFIPVLSARSEKKDLNMNRAGKIVIEATEQCGRNLPPIVHPVTKLEDVFKNFDMSFIVLEKGEVSFIKENIKDNPIGLMVGPEGGWTKEELQVFRDKKVDFRSLGQTTLRAETAAIVGSTLLLIL